MQHFAFLVGIPLAFLAIAGVIFGTFRTSIKSGKSSTIIVFLNPAFTVALYLFSYFRQIPAVIAFRWSVKQVILCLVVGTVLYAISLSEGRQKWRKVAKGLLLSVALILLISVPSCVTLVDQQGGIFYGIKNFPG